MRALLALAVGAILALAGPALADWRFTHWGMSRQEVIDATGGRAGDPPPADADPQWSLRLVQDMDAYRAHFDHVSFRFVDGRLERLEMVGQGDFDAIAAALAAEMGPPVHTEQMGGVKEAEFNDSAHGDTIQLTSYGSGVDDIFLHYGGPGVSWSRPSE